VSNFEYIDHRTHQGQDASLYRWCHLHYFRPTTHTHTRIMALCPGLPGWAGTRKVKPIWILLKQETVSGSGISWDICKSAPRSRQITMPALHCSVQTNKYEINILPFHSRFPTTEPSKIIGLGQLNQATKRHTHRQQNM